MNHEPTTANLPTHDVFIVEGEGKNAFWTRICAAWPHKDEQGFNLRLKCIPLDGRVSLRIRSNQPDAPAVTAER